MTADWRIHRHLDEAFAGVERTAEIQDLKSELLSSLQERSAELVAGGTEAETAARQAIDELGDVRAIIADTVSDPLPLVTTVRVRPRAGFVVGIVLLSLLLAAAIALVVLGACDLLDLGVAIPSSIVAGATGGAITAWSLRQETTQHYPSPTSRSVYFGVAAGILLTGVSLLVLSVTHLPGLGLIIPGAILLLAGIALGAAMLATQTNRTKEWTRQHAWPDGAPDAFTANPAAAARFGLYSVAIWIAGITVFAVLSFTIGFAWSWLALIGALVLNVIVLARTLFPDHKEEPETT